MALKPGPWMKDALEVVMAWQLRNPSITDPTQAIEEVKKTRKGELTSRLISRFLSLTIRPLFLQTDSSSSSPFPTSSKTSKGVAKTWRDPENAYIVEILRWCLEAASEEDVKREFHLFRVPILQMLDSSELKWKAQACDLIARFVSVAPKDLLSSHGYRKLFAEDLFNLFTYLPSLTPEAESVLVFDRAMPALLTLSTLEEVGDDKMADRIVREAVLAPFFTLSSTSTYPALTTTILSHLPSLLSMLGVSSVAHLPSLLPPLLSILRDPFIPASPQLLIADARALQSLVREAWMRIDVARAVEVATSVCEAWVACVGYGSGEDVEAGKRELKRTVALVEKRVVELDGGTKDVWEGEKARLVGDKSMFAELFEGGEGAGATA
jgi:tRNA nucleotidyltransferase (CCA-adding enzyme)